MKRLVVSIFFLLSMFIPVSVNAQNKEEIQEYEIEENDSIIYVVDNIVFLESGAQTTRQVVYEGIIVPDQTIYVTAKNQKDGITYGGTLYLISYTYQNNQTIAVYKGTLYPLD